MNKEKESKLEKDRYRFGGFRYGFRGPAKSGPDSYVPKETSFYTFPKEDTTTTTTTKN